MSKGLKALKKIEKEMSRLCGMDIAYDGKVFDLFSIVGKELQTLEIVKKLFDFDFALRFPNNQSMLRITNKRTGEYWEIPISKEEYELLKEVLL